MACSISPWRVTRLLAMVVAALTLLSVLGRLAVLGLPDFPLRDFTARLFDLDQEMNIPTVYSALAILACSALLAVIARSQRRVGGARDDRHWWALSLIFLGLAFDELLSFHEELTGRVDFGAFSRVTLFSWVVLGAAFVLAVAAAFSRFLTRLPAATRRLFLLAGAVFVAGAIVMEAVSGYYGGPGRQDSLAYVIVAHVEEVLEMAGIVVFIYASLSYLRRTTPVVVVRLDIEDERRARQDQPAHRDTRPPTGAATEVGAGRSGSATAKDAAGSQGVTDGTDPTSRG
jgi:hypothetical protein